jgi:hypothetical protein
MSIDIILAEDDPADVRPTVDAIGDGKMKSHLAVGLQAFLHAIQPIEDFCFSVARLPGRTAYGCEFN